MRRKVLEVCISIRAHFIFYRAELAVSSGNGQDFLYWSFSRLDQWDKGWCTAVHLQWVSIVKLAESQSTVIGTILPPTFTQLSFSLLLPHKKTQQHWADVFQWLSTQTTRVGLQIDMVVCLTFAFSLMSVSTAFCSSSISQRHECNQNPGSNVVYNKK